MKRTPLTTMAAQAVLLCALLSGLTGCNREVVGEVATLSGAYLGDVVSALATSYLRDTLDIEDSGSPGEDSHEAGPLHDHEH